MNRRERRNEKTELNIFKNVKVEEIEKIRKYTIVKMIRSKMLDKYKIRG